MTDDTGTDGRMVNLFISNTDNRWFDFLNQRAPLQEVNFWQPSATNFRAVTAGEFFVFRLKAPRNAIGGFGVLSSAILLPIQFAWDAFGEGNGVSSLGEFIRYIQEYRKDQCVTAQTVIGCRVLTQPIFLDEHLWWELPRSWSKNIVGGKTYSTSSAEGQALWMKLDHMLAANQVAPGMAEGATRYGGPQLIRPRLGQGSFRVSVIEAYNRQCALTDGRVLPALEAAHIKPYKEGGQHVRSNGILLRRDIHSVFDAGYAMIDERYRFVVSERVKTVFNNGSEYRKLHGKQLRLPKKTADHPDRTALQWHAENRFETA